MQNQQIYVVAWLDGCFYAVQKNSSNGSITSIRYLLQELVENGAVVIGNIHDNPELFGHLD